MADRRITGRLAPSPTGAQHVGNARTYLIAWLSARARNGRVVLRIEDIDSPRIKAGAAAQALADLRWLGLDWDDGPLVQTERLNAYQECFGRLQAQERVYPCTCSRTDIEQAASAPHLDHEGPVYPGTCAHRRVKDAAHWKDRTAAWRFRLGSTTPEFADGFRERVSIDLHAVGGDFVVWKSAGGPAYQLAVVVDDAFQGVTEVIRGDDLVSSTPRQLLLYDALGLQAPSFAHIPLVVGPDGRRLAKRHGDTRLVSLQERGVRAEALLGLLAYSCRWIDRVAPVALVELLSLFRLESIPRVPFVLNDALLRQIGYHA